MATGHEHDIIIVGGGLVGLSLARALAEADLSLALVEPQPPAAASAASFPADGWDTRVYAVSPGSAAFLERCGAWQHLPPDRVARVESMCVYGDAAASLEFTAYDAGIGELAWIVEARALQHGLRTALRGQDMREYCPANWTELAIEPGAAALLLDNGPELKAKLVVGADGAESRVRAAAGIAVATREYGQLGVVANFSCERPHRGVAFQWFMRDGVLALLPLPGDRVSMVWSIARKRGQELLGLAAQDLAAAVQAASRGTLGALQLFTPPTAFPLKLQRVTQFVKPRLALVGDAAHNVHPLAGQGMNLGFRDARVLADTLIERGAWRDCGDYALLRRYERARKEDVLALQVTTDGLQNR